MFSASLCAAAWKDPDIPFNLRKAREPDLTGSRTVSIRKRSARAEEPGLPHSQELKLGAWS